MLTGSHFMFGFDSVPKTGFLLKTISVYLSINCLLHLTLYYRCQDEKLGITSRYYKSIN